MPEFFFYQARFLCSPAMATTPHCFKGQRPQKMQPGSKQGMGRAKEHGCLKHLPPK